MNAPPLETSDTLLTKVEQIRRENYARIMREREQKTKLMADELRLACELDVSRLKARIEKLQTTLEEELQQMLRTRQLRTDEMVRAEQEKVRMFAQRVEHMTGRPMTSRGVTGEVYGCGTVKERIEVLDGMVDKRIKNRRERFLKEQEDQERERLRQQNADEVKAHYAAMKERRLARMEALKATMAAEAVTPIDPEEL